MAQIQLGTIITDIKGSIAGTTFRKSQHAISVYNKIGRNFKNSSKRNSKKGVFANTSNDYNNLTDEQLAWWQNNAKRFKFLNKFGNEVIITARQLFMKLNLNLSVTGVSVPNTGSMVSEVQTTSIESVTINTTSQTATINITNTVDNCYICFAAKVVSKGRTTPNINKTEIIASFYKSRDMYFDIENEFFAKYPFVVAAQKIQISCYTINDFGFKSAISYAFTVAV